MAALAKDLAFVLLEANLESKPAILNVLRRFVEDVYTENEGIQSTVARVTAANTNLIRRLDSQVNGVENDALEEAGTEVMPRTVSAMRIKLAEKDKEISRLQGKVAERDAEIKRLRFRLGDRMEEDIPPQMDIAWYNQRHLRPVMNSNDSGLKKGDLVSALRLTEDAWVALKGPTEELLQRRFPEGANFNNKTSEYTRIVEEFVAANPSVFEDESRFDSKIDNWQEVKWKLARHLLASINSSMKSRVGKVYSRKRKYAEIEAPVFTPEGPTKDVINREEGKEGEDGKELKRTQSKAETRENKGETKMGPEALHQTAPASKPTTLSAKDSFVCTICMSSFQCQEHLSQHTIIHKAENSYNCSTCGQRFSHTDNLKQHQMIHDECMAAASPREGSDIVEDSPDAPGILKFFGPKHRRKCSPMVGGFEAMIDEIGGLPCQELINDELPLTQILKIGHRKTIVP